MTPAPEAQRVISFVHGRRVLQVAVARLDERTLEVVVEENRRTWTFRVPAWRTLSFGSSGDDVYLWSARQAVVLPSEDTGDIQTIDVEEDILFVFRVPGGWVLVCETSLRLWTDGTFAARLELSDVVERVRWEGDHLMIDVWEAGRARVAVGDGELRIDDESTRDSTTTR